MFHFAANYIFNGRNLIKNAFLSVDADGKILYVSEENEALIEKALMAYYNGILCPGLINSHCHLELSGFKSKFDKNPGLAKFISEMLEYRKQYKKVSDIEIADRVMYENGVSVVADIVNTDMSIEVKEKSPIYYKNFIELSGLDFRIVDVTYDKGIEIAEKFLKHNLNANITIHSFYSASLELQKKVSEISDKEMLSIHFLESEEEKRLYLYKNGNLYDYLRDKFKGFVPVCNNLNGLSNLIKYLNSNKTILVHNVMLEKRSLVNLENIFFCLCPNSNLLLHGAMPTLEFVNEIKDEFLVGTDSLASNKKLCILSELKTLEEKYSFLTIEQLLSAATINGANALGVREKYGSFEIGKTPGIVLIENSDLKNKRLGEFAEVKRIM